jgi:hypothetical protein
MDEEEAAASPSENFETLLRDGPEVGVHTVAWCDTYANVTRAVPRQTIREFRTRIAGAMSNEDSMSLLDDYAAARLDKPHRLVLFDDDRPGALEKFRPYSLPDQAWLHHMGKTLHERK